MIIIFSIIISILILSLIGLSIVFYKYTKKKTILDHTAEVELDRSINDKRKQLIQMASDIDELAEQKEDLDKRYQVRRKELDDMLLTQTEEAKRTAAVAAQNAAASQESLVNLNAEVSKISDEIKGLLDKKRITKNELEGVEASLSKIKPQLDDCLLELDKKLATHRALLLTGENGYKNGWLELSITDKEMNLIRLISEIKNNYPEIKSDISSIEWKRIWLPKLQGICSGANLDGKTGIYRLVLKKNEKISYVGQASNIKERWYQHVKKMVGVDPVGNEKLYEYQPNDFWWTILETCDKTALNEKERYWIDYYCCKEIGLNTK